MKARRKFEHRDAEAQRVTDNQKLNGETKK